MSELEYDRGGGDHDEPFRFGRKPTASWPSPFTLRELVRLALLKARVRGEDGRYADVADRLVETT